MSLIHIRFTWAQFLSCLVLFTMPFELFANEERTLTSAALEEMGIEIERALNERDEASFARMVDLHGLGYRVAATTMDSEKERSDYARGFSTGSSDRLVRALFGQLKSSPDISAKFMRLVERGAERRPLIRMDLAALGFDYVEYVIERDTSGVARIVDWYALSAGELASTSVGALSQLMMEPAPGLLKAMFGLQTIDQATVQRMRKIGDLRGKGAFKEALSEMSKLPPEIATSRILLVQRAGLASAINDEDAYRSTLEELAKRYGDHPQAAFMLIDHYIYTQDFDRSLRAFERVEKRVGIDGMTRTSRANILVLANRLDDAEKSAREGMSLEPDYAGSYFSLADILIARERFDDAVKVFRTLESDFGYEFSRDALVAQPTYAKFVGSPAFKNWQP